LAKLSPGYYNNNNNPTPPSATKSAPTSITESMRWTLRRVGIAPVSETGALVQWAYDKLALSREAGKLVQFRKVRAHRTDNSTGSRRYREANKLANQGRLMDLAEFGLPPDPPGDPEEETAQPVLHPLDWDEVFDDLILPADSQMGVPTPAAGPGHDYLPPAVGQHHPVPPMLIATQDDTTHPVPPSMHIHSVPCNDTHPKTTSSSHSSASRSSMRALRPKPVPRSPRRPRRINPEPTEVNLAFNPVSLSALEPIGSLVTSLHHGIWHIFLLRPRSRTPVYTPDRFPSFFCYCLHTGCEPHAFLPTGRYSLLPL